MTRSMLTDVAKTILSESSTDEELRDALDRFSQLCAEVTGINPDPTFDAWAEDTFLDNGVAINPQAAAFCLHDYQRSIVFMRGLDAAINAAKSQFPLKRLRLLYAGCGPFATLILPLLTRLCPDDIDITLLDIHASSLESVSKLIEHFDVDHFGMTLVEADASQYQSEGPFHVIVAEVMQKALEQEPQFAVTANLANQLYPNGIFLPQSISVALCTGSQEGQAENTESLSQLMVLTPEYAVQKTRELAPTVSKPECIPLGACTLPAKKERQQDVLLMTRLCVFDQHVLEAYESNITLPYKCPDLHLKALPAHYQASYQLGRYPLFVFEADD